MTAVARRLACAACAAAAAAAAAALDDDDFLALLLPGTAPRCCSFADDDCVVGLPAADCLRCGGASSEEPLDEPPR